MPRGHKGEKRPADVIGNAVKVMRIATGQIEENTDEQPAAGPTAAEIGRMGGQARAKSLSKKKRAEIARKAAEKRWSKDRA